MVSNLLRQTGQLEQTMAKGFYLGSRLRRYAYTNQFGARTPELQNAVSDLITHSDAVVGSRIKGTLLSDVFHSMNLDENENDSESLVQGYSELGTL
jgi:hypothetical protein